MRIDVGRIDIVRMRKPCADAEANELLQWFGRSLGMFGLRDRDKSCFRLFIELLKSGRGDKALSSDELAYRLRLSRGTVVHHLTRLMDSGIVIKSGNSYLLREHSLVTLVEEIREDMERACDDLRAVAELIDMTLRP